MNTALFYGLVLAVAQMVVSLVAFFLGFQTERIAMESWVSLVSFVVLAVVLWLGIRARRQESQNGSLSYGGGVKTGFLISLYGGLIGMVYSVVYILFINPAYADYRIDATRPQWVKAGFSDARMAAAERGMRFVLSPVPLAILGLLLTVAFGVVITLILAAFLKRDATPGGPPVLPAAMPPPA